MSSFCHLPILFTHPSCLDLQLTTLPIALHAGAGVRKSTFGSSIAAPSRTVRHHRRSQQRCLRPQLEAVSALDSSTVDEVLSRIAGSGEGKDDWTIIQPVQRLLLTSAKAQIAAKLWRRRSRPASISCWRSWRLEGRSSSPGHWRIRCCLGTSMSHMFPPAKRPGRMGSVSPHAAAQLRLARQLLVLTACVQLTILARSTVLPETHRFSTGRPCAAHTASCCTAMPETPACHTGRLYLSGSD